MSIQKNPEYTAYEITEQNVVEFLETHPDFFARHEDILLKLQISHNSGDAISILEYQINRLREQNDSSRTKLIELVNVARENDRLNERIHRLTLELIATQSIDDVIDVLNELFHKEFHAQWVNVLLFNNENITASEHKDNIIDLDEHISTQFENFFKANRPLCGRLKGKQVDYLFGEDSDKVNSAILIPLGKQSNIGMIAIGSEDENRFHSGMGTIYIKQMADIISQTVRRFLT